MFKYGQIEIICGSMFSGKTEELINRIKKVEFSKEKFAVFKPLKDSRNKGKNITSHSGITITAKSVENAKEIYLKSKNINIIAIDEAQFFDMDLVEICTKLANENKRVIVSGLDMDFEGKPFGPMPQLMACAEHVTKLHAICNETGELANFTFRKINSNDKILIGDKTAYEALSRKAFIKKMKNRK